MEAKNVCFVCGKHFIQSQGLGRHICSVHEKESFSCNSCNRKFSSKDYLRDHEKTHIEVDFECDHCQELFKNKQSLKQHVKTIHGNKALVCMAELSLVMPKFVREEEPGMINKILRLVQEGESIHAKMNRLEAKFRMILNKSQRYWSMLKEYENKLYN